MNPCEIWANVFSVRDAFCSYGAYASTPPIERDQLKKTSYVLAAVNCAKYIMSKQKCQHRQ